MSKSILVIDEEELTFLKQITNHFTNSNTSQEGVSVVNKIRNAQDTTELLKDFVTVSNFCITNACGHNTQSALHKLHKALGGKV